MKSLYINKFINNDADIEVVYNDNTNEVTMYVAVAEFEESKNLEKEELKRIIDSLTKMYDKLNIENIEG